MNWTLFSPIEIFEVVNLAGLHLPLFNINFTLTNLGVFTIILLTLILISTSQGINHFKLVQSRISLIVETIYTTFYSIVLDQIGSRNQVYFPFILAIFTFILIANFLGNIGYTFTVTSSIIVCFGLSFIVWFGVTFLGIIKHGLHFASLFVPSGCPLALVPFLCIIELISYIVRALSLGVRLFANIVGGHTVLLVIGGFIYKGFSNGMISIIFTLLPFGLFLALVGLEIAVSAIQAFVFTLLTCSYLKDSLDLH